MTPPLTPPLAALRDVIATATGYPTAVADLPDDATPPFVVIDPMGGRASTPNAATRHAHLHPWWQVSIIGLTPLQASIASDDVLDALSALTMPHRVNDDVSITSWHLAAPGGPQQRPNDPRQLFTVDHTIELELSQ